MEKSELEHIIEAAQHWLEAVSQIQTIAETGAWDDLELWHRKREEAVATYQKCVASFDYSQYSATALLPLEQLLLTLKQMEGSLVDRFQDYQHQLAESLKSVKMEDTLSKRYGADDV